MIITMPDSVSVQTPHRGKLLAVEILSWTAAGGHVVEREVVRHPGAVLVVPRLDGDRFVLVRNYRVAVDQRLWELPAGTLEAGEAPEHAAGRELEEETGYHAERLELLGEFFTSPGFCDELMRVYVADGLEWVGQRLEPHEEIEVGIVSRDETLAMIDDGRIRDGKTIAAIAMTQRAESGGTA